jgi:hypothetical protein
MKGEDKRIVNVASFAASRAPTIDFNQVNSSNHFLPKYYNFWHILQQYGIKMILSG